MKLDSPSPAEPNLRSLLDQIEIDCGGKSELFREEIRELLEHSEADRRELIHFPDVIDLIPPLVNGSRIIAVDFRSIPGQSSKVIPMDHMFTQAEQRGEISPERTPHLIIASSGNAAIWFTEIAKRAGYSTVHVVTPDYASTPRINALSALGAEIYFVRGELGVQGMIDYAENLERTTPGATFLNQTYSEDNFASFVPQGRRVARKLLLKNLSPTHFVAGVGTGGTFTGMSMGILERVPDCQCIAVEVREKTYLKRNYPLAALEGFDPDHHLAEATADDSFWIEDFSSLVSESSQIPGLAANIPGENLIRLFRESDRTKIMTVGNLTGMKSARLLGRKYQQFVGPSTGMSFAAALTIAENSPGSIIVMPICDGGWQYEGDLWHKEKREITEGALGLNGFRNSFIGVRTVVQAEQRTPHLSPKEMGGPLSTASLLHLIEEVCHDLELQCGVPIDLETFGVNFGPLNHKTYVPVGTQLEVSAKIIKEEEKNGKTYLTYLVKVHAINSEGTAVEVCDPVEHKRVITQASSIRERAEQRFPQSKL